MKFDIAIVDADSILYKVALSAQEVYYCVGDKRFPEKANAITYIDKHGGELTVEKESTKTMDEMVQYYDDTIDYIKDTTDSTKAFCYTGSKEENFRYAIATIHPYKGNRANTSPPLHLATLKQHLLDTGRLIHASPGMEADDQVIIEMLKYEADDVPVVLCTIDKDSKQKDGWHFNFNTGDIGLIDSITAHASFYKQLLTGDSTDNIPGLFGVGDKSKLVKDLSNMETEAEMFKHCYSQYDKRFGSYAERFCCENFRLLYMNRTENTEDGLERFMWLHNEMLMRETND